MQPTLLTETSRAVRIIRFCRPERLNAIDVTLAAELTAALRDAEIDASVRCVLLEADGQHFMAGGNVKDFKEKMGLSKAERRIIFESQLHVLHPALYLMRRIGKPVLCAVNGAAAGAGFSLVLASDFVVASEDAFFVLSHVSIGASPDAGATYFLPRLVGARAALELAILGERVMAEEAKRLGLVTRICARQSLREESRKLAERLALGPSTAFARTKFLIDRSLDQTLETQLQAEAESFATCAATDDMEEGVVAFLEKRDPRFGARS